MDIKFYIKKGMYYWCILGECNGKLRIAGAYNTYRSAKRYFEDNYRNPERDYYQIYRFDVDEKTSTAYRAYMGS